MRTRSEWFLTPMEGRLTAIDSDPTTIHILHGSNRSSSGNIATGLSASAESVKRLPSLRRNSSRDKQRLHRTSSRRNKENGAMEGNSRSTAAAESCKSHSLDMIKTVKIVRMTTAADKQQSAVEKMLDDSHNEIIEERAIKEARIPSRTGGIGLQDCTEMDVKTFHVTLTYKPRI